MPKTGRSLIGTLAGFMSECWSVFDRNAGRLHVEIRRHGRRNARGDAAGGAPDR